MELQPDKEVSDISVYGDGGDINAFMEKAKEATRRLAKDFAAIHRRGPNYLHHALDESFSFSGLDATIVEASKLSEEDGEKLIDKWIEEHQK